MTIPVRIAEAAGIGPGDTFIVEHQATDPDTLRLRRIRTSYAAALRGIYGRADAYLERQRSDWEQR
ncbi:MAG: hypothetical protein ACRDGJ_01865 [Candidatus Limnocylindria bacterium]